MKNIFLTLLAIVFTQVIFAQGSSYTLSYPISLPMSDLKDYIGATSFRGISMEFNKRQKPNLEIGLEIGWNVFYERQDQKTYESGTASIHGVQYRYTNSVPMIVGAKYVKTGSGTASPYVGIGLGTTYVERATDFGLYRITNDAWQFTVRPEIGVMFKMRPGLSGLIGAKYYQNFNTDDLDGQSFLSFNIGFVFSTW